MPIELTEESAALVAKPKTYNVFVYGTLKYGYGNHRVLYDPKGFAPKFLGRTQTPPAWDIIPNGPNGGGFPFVIPGTLKIEGEMYEVSETVFQQCDRLEGYPTFYGRVHMQFANGLYAWMYVPVDHDRYRRLVSEQPDLWNEGVYMCAENTKVWVR
jgi:gamma-glutamylcyclotransferase (GGCT)/AIG2-like uncharacterized protein YtfP